MNNKINELSDNFEDMKFYYDSICDIFHEFVEYCNRQTVMNIRFAIDDIDISLKNKSVFCNIAVMMSEDTEYFVLKYKNNGFTCKNTDISNIAMGFFNG